LIIILVIAIFAVLGFVYYRGNNTGTAGGNGGGGTNFFARFNPFARNTNIPGSSTPGGNENPGQPAGEVEVTAGKLRKVSSLPVAGFAVFLKERLKEIPVPIEVVGDSASKTAPKTNAKPTPPPTEFMPALRYVERATGNIYQTFADKIEERKFSRTVIPKIHDAFFGRSGQAVVMRHLKPDDQTIETFVGALPKEILGEDVDNYEITGSFLAENIQDLSLSPDTSRMFYLLNGGEGVVGTIFSFQDSKKIQVFGSPFTEWLSYWPSSKIVTLSTKPSALVPGYMYMINLDTKGLTRVLSGINGLTTLMSPDGKLVLYGDNNLSLQAYQRDTKTSTLLGVRTLPEKCTWNKVSAFVYCAVPVDPPAGLYPDGWYRGEIAFSDQIWRINIESGSAELLADPLLLLGTEIDGTRLALDAGEDYLFFVNKKDSSLWELKLD